MTAETEVTHEDVSLATPITARDAAADASADASIVSEVSIVSAAAEETRNHQPRGSNGRFVGRPAGADGIPDAVAPVSDAEPQPARMTSSTTASGPVTARTAVTGTCAPIAISCRSGARPAR